MFKTNSFLNPLINSSITEYDIKSGNTSMMEYFNLRPYSVIEELKSLPKKQRVENVGKMIRSDPEFGRQLEQSFDKIVQMFIEANELDEDNIVSIKRDAVFVRSKDITQRSFGTCVNFIPKNRYQGFIKVQNYEFWIIDKEHLDLKGVNSDAVEKLLSGPIDMILYIYDQAVQCGMSKKHMNQVFAMLVDTYKRRELPVEYYREFGSEPQFRVKIGNREAMMDYIDNSMLQYLQIGNNYQRLIMPLMKIFC